MTTNGFALREALRQWELTRDGAAAYFTDSLKKFPDEDKPAPDKVMTDFVTAEEAIAKIQRAQAVYNLRVLITVQEAQMTLLEGVKRLGGAGRAAKMWRVAAGDEGSRKRNLGYGEDVRKSDEIRQQPTISREDAMSRAKQADRFASALRAAIAKGNVTDIELDLDPFLLR